MGHNSLDKQPEAAQLVEAFGLQRLKLITGALIVSPSLFQRCSIYQSMLARGARSIPDKNQTNRASSYDIGRKMKGENVRNYALSCSKARKAAIDTNVRQTAGRKRSCTRFNRITKASRIIEVQM